MSYDVGIFGAFGSHDTTAEIQAVIEAFHLISGSNIEFGAKANTHGRPKLFGLEFALGACPSFLVDTTSQAFSRYKWEINVRTRDASGPIHPLSFFVAEELSRRLNTETMLCFNGTELHAATFSAGRLRFDNVANALGRVSGGVGWIYRSPFSG